MRKNTALAKWRAGEQTIGGWLSLANTHTAEMMANAGFDWLCVDMQHGLLDYQDLLHMLPAISTTDTIHDEGRGRRSGRGTRLPGEGTGKHGLLVANPCTGLRDCTQFGASAVELCGRTS